MSDEADPAEGAVTLGQRQLATVLRELEVALNELEQLAHLCSIQERANRAEEAISAALYLLRAAQRRSASGR